MILQALAIAASSSAFQIAGIQAGLNTFFANMIDFLPNLIAFLIILFVGYLIVQGVIRAVRYGMKRASFERHVGHTRLGQAVEKSGHTFTNIVVTVVKWLLYLVVVVYAITALGIAALTLTMEGVLAWIPVLAAVAIIVFVGALVASWIGSMIENTLPRYGVGGGRIIGLAVELLIYAVVFNYAMIQIGFAQGILYMITTALAWGFAAALAIGFGVALAYALREVIPPMVTGSTTVASTLKEGQSVSVLGIPNTGNGGVVSGRVRSVGMFNTILEKADGGFMILPNNLLMDKPITIDKGSEPPTVFENEMRDRMHDVEQKFDDDHHQTVPRETTNP